MSELDLTLQSMALIQTGNVFLFNLHGYSMPLWFMFLFIISMITMLVVFFLSRILSVSFLISLLLFIILSIITLGIMFQPIDTSNLKSHLKHDSSISAKDRHTFDVMKLCQNSFCDKSEELFSNARYNSDLSARYAVPVSDEAKTLSADNQNFFEKVLERKIPFRIIAHVSGDAYSLHRREIAFAENASVDTDIYSNDWFFVKLDMGQANQIWKVPAFLLMNMKPVSKDKPVISDKDRKINEARKEFLNISNQATSTH